MKSDLLRYLVLYIAGGVYTDTDTTPLRPIDDWVPDGVNGVKLVVGPEFDRGDDGLPWADIPHWLQLSQWTLAAAPGHPVLRAMIDGVLRSVARLEAKYGVGLERPHPSSLDVMKSTGPAAWTDVVMAHLRRHDASLTSTHGLSAALDGHGPRLLGDVLVLDIDGFGMGQDHSHSTNDGSVPGGALARHWFRGSWRSS